ncbi:MAG: homocysteine methyltransferase [Candidatus Omnitrophota bacterium]|jgi:5-methyltetrahydrofolate--homocysteine methyltransferase|nr:MAG: homocysteine methyltransferase [Candidatus Omnitrophota bacterium]
MNHSFFQLLETRPLLVGDGGMGTMLLQAGLEQGSCGELWNVERLETIAEIQRCYVDAGSDFILTNTFGGSPPTLAKHGLAGRTEELNEAGVKAARAAADGRCLVLGDIGPSGEILEPYGDKTFDDLREDFKRQAAGLASGGVDAFIIETMMDINEVRCAFTAVRDVSDLPIIISMCFKAAGDRYRTMFGTSATDAAREMESLGAAAAGSNCMVEIEEFIPIVRQMREGTSLPIMAQPNAGQPRLEGDKAVYATTAEAMMPHVPALVEAGARLLGGCCGTTPDYIRLLRQWVDKSK